MSDDQTDVLIVGAGPSGLVLANVLAAHGVRFVILDRKPGPVTESRAALVHVRTLGVLDSLGLAERAIAQGSRITRVEVHERGRMLAEIPLTGHAAAALTPFPFALGLEQGRMERLLVDGLTRAGRTVRWDTELAGVTDTPAGTTASVMRRGEPSTISARWVVGADGASSRVRHVAGLGFAGGTYAQTGFLADVQFADNGAAAAPARVSRDAERVEPSGARPSAGALRLTLTRSGFVGMLELHPGRYRLFGAVPPHLAARPKRDADPSHDPYAAVSRADLQRWLDDLFRVDATIGHVAWTALYRIHSRSAERFRAGSTFLIGDAAHIHSPAGGQGMNLGIGDAANLGWKLALVAKGVARTSLLDSYEAERVPVARAVLRGTDRGFALETAAGPLARWARATVAPPLVGPLLRVPAVQRQVFRLFSQTWIGYGRGPAVAAGRRSRERVIRPGDRVPYGPGLWHGIVPDATRHRVLLFPPGRHDARAEVQRRALDEVLARYTVDVPVHVVGQRADAAEAHLVLVRPDGHAAWSGPIGDLPDLVRFMDRLYRRACGDPSSTDCPAIR